MKDKIISSGLVLYICQAMFCKNVEEGMHVNVVTQYAN